MKSISILVDEYIKYHQNAWAPTSLRSERARLSPLTPVLDLNEDPRRLLNSIRGRYKPYALKTLFIRLRHFYDWLVEQGYRERNDFRIFMKQNANTFKGSYNRKTVEIGFEEAKNRILTIENEDVRDACLALLTSGLRLHELGKVEGEFVVGKRGKRRRVFTGKSKVAQHRIRYALKKLGLKPHDLRKLFATRLAERGTSPQDLCQIMGWNSFNTAYWYLQAAGDEKLEELVNGSICQ